MKKTMLNVFAVAMIMVSIASCSSKKNTETTEKTKGGHPSVEELFAQMDSNKDGKLSKAEVKGPLADNFSKIDTNSDGFISKEELTKAPKPSGQRPPQGQGGGQRPGNGR